jgi:hypothetical protein
MKKVAFDRDRTDDHLIKSQALYQLSYKGGVCARAVCVYVYYVQVKECEVDLLVAHHDVHPERVVPPVGVELSEVGIEVAVRREGGGGAEDPDADAGKGEPERRLRAGDRRDRLLGVQVVVEERLALGGLPERLRGLLDLLVDERLLAGGDGHEALLGEDLLQLDDREGVSRAPDALRRLLGLLGRARERRERLLGLLGGAVARQRLKEVRLLGRHPAVGAARRRHPRAVAVGDALGVRLAAGVARLELRAVRRRVPGVVAVAALVLQELGAAHLAVLPGRVLNEVAGEDALGEPLRLAVGAEHREVLGRRLGRLLGDGSH